MLVGIEAVESVMIKSVRDGYDVQKRLSVKVVQSTIEIGLVVVSSGDSYMCVCGQSTQYNTAERSRAVQYSDKAIESVAPRNRATLFSRDEACKLQRRLTGSNDLSVCYHGHDM